MDLNEENVKRFVRLNFASRPTSIFFKTIGFQRRKPKEIPSRSVDRDREENAIPFMNTSRIRNSIEFGR
ncbi:hypothetical protein BES34_013095 [Leptospira inadai serovar Lyme]|uniref:Uncharacterized protein n=1 Tax=Leptospira inadai serovar Lyme TaxID=293084 RepID=A0ABX4YGY7_9LEPT|nr:hypothetical protein BES34_013095 [Leptospira inadai serovar Lyme]